MAKLLSLFPLTIQTKEPGNSGWNCPFFIVLHRDASPGTAAEERFEMGYFWRKLPSFIKAVFTGKRRDWLQLREEYGGGINAYVDGETYTSQAAYKLANRTGWYSGMWKGISADVLAVRMGNALWSIPKARVAKIKKWAKTI